MHRASPSPRNLRILRYTAVLSFMLVLALQAVYAANETPVAPNTKSTHSAEISTRPFAHFALGVSAGTLGPGVELVTTLSRRSNLRVDGQFFNYAQNFSQNGISYNANLRLRDYRASYDYFPFAGAFRISAGVEAYNQFNVNASANVPAGQTVTLNDVDYYSSASDPLHGSASVAYPNKYAPTVTVGFGNAIPRSGRHWAFPVEIGAAFTGTPAFNLAMSGSACATSDPATCAPVSADPTFQSNLAAQRQKIVKDIAPFRFYPILSTGFTYRF